MQAINNWLHRRQQGIGLLELMLSLAVIAILLVMATRYYLTTSRSERANEAIQEVQAVVTAVSDIYRTQGKIPTEDLTKAIIPYIPAPYVVNGTTINDPWGVPINPTRKSDSEVTITLTPPDEGTGRLIATRLGFTTTTYTPLTITIDGAKGTISG